MRGQVHEHDGVGSFETDVDRRVVVSVDHPARGGDELALHSLELLHPQRVPPVVEVDGIHVRDRQVQQPAPVSVPRTTCRCRRNQRWPPVSRALTL